MFKRLENLRFAPIFWVFFYIFLTLLALKGSFSYLDPDFGWHLQVGQEIALSQQVPSDNHFNYTFQGNWVDHEWLSNWLIYQVYSAQGYLALSLIFALLIIITLVVLNWFTRERIKKKGLLAYITIFQLLGLIAALGSTGIRIQEIAWLFLLVVFITLYYFNKGRNWKSLLVLPPLFYLWANLHASFLIGLFVLFFWLGLKILEKILAWWPGEARLSWIDFSGLLKKKEFFVFSGFAGLSVIATLLTPYRLGLYDFLQGYGRTFYLSYIQEWLPQGNFPFNYRQLLYLALVVVALLIYVYFVKRRQYWKLNLVDFCIVLLFLILSFSSRRHFPLLFISSFVFLIEVYSTVLPLSIGPLKPPYRWLAIFVFLCLGLSSLVTAWQIKFVQEPFSSFCGQYPCGAVDFLKQNPEYEDAKIFNSYNWGGFLIRVYPERKLFIDGRLPQVAYSGQTLLEEYVDFYRPDIGAGKIRQYDIRLILIEAQDRPLRARPWERFLFRISDEELKTRNYLREYLASSTDWQVVFQDGVSMIYWRP